MTSLPSPTFSPERDQAIHLLKDWLLKGSLPSESGDWQQCSALTREMVWTCMRQKGSLDAWIDKLSFKRPAPILIPVLWVGLCQILFLDGVPEHAAVHETLEAAKRSGVPPARIGFANALFRRALRERQELLDWMEQQIPEIRYSHPKMLVDRWIEFFGREKTEQILQWNQQRAHTYARISKGGIALRSQLALPAESIVYEGEGSTGQFYQLPRGYAPAELADFYDGAWYIQDPSTRIAPQMLKVQPGEDVLDACAAPGGKTCMMAEALGDQSERLLACDPNPKRCERLKENLDRMKFPQVQIQCANISELLASHAGHFDAILLDVPCSNTGVYQRRADAKWNFRRRLLTELIQLQYKILEDAAKLLKPGGRLVYSTCSIEAEETTRQIQNWLGQHPDFSQLDQKLLLPGDDKCDGAFVALILKNG